MFTGLIQEIGTIKCIKKQEDSMYITIECADILNEIKIGDSVAINGACQTVTTFDKTTFTVFASSETLKVTNFKHFKVNEKVNLERTLRLCDRLDGHIVSGHVDTTGIIKNIVSNNETTIFSIELSQAAAKQSIKKGSIAIDGISLTIADINDVLIDIAVIPHTLKSTILQYKKIGDIVNVETDMIAKYVEKYLLSNNNNSSNITMDLLERNGFL